MTMLPETARLGLSMRFDVTVGGIDLGAWATCKGLAVTFRQTAIKALGQHGFTSYVPGRVEYAPVKLERAIAKGEWTKVKGWLERMVDASEGSDATITLRDSSLGEVATWTLRNALPAAWKGPSLDAKGNSVALETLELVHEGFLDG